MTKSFLYTVKRPNNEVKQGTKKKFVKQNISSNGSTLYRQRYRYTKYPDSFVTIDRKIIEKKKNRLVSFEKERLRYTILLNVEYLYKNCQTKI